MRFGQFILFSTVAATLAMPAIAATRTHRRPTAAHKTSTSKSTAKHAAKAHIVGQRTIDDDRATQIQSALIKAGYLTGSPSGHWDAESEAAMQKLQGDNGWQTKLVPDSRALIKLGLGPTTTAAEIPVSPADSLSAQNTPLASAAQ
jgi:peptidoglycan hydrolase-like protein with peptidoglycan-binding domain